MVGHGVGGLPPSQQHHAEWAERLQRRVPGGRVPVAGVSPKVEGQLMHGVMRPQSLRKLLQVSSLDEV